MKTKPSLAGRARAKLLENGLLGVSCPSWCLTQYKESNTLLSYALVTSPSPVQVSPTSGSPSLATVTLVVSCPPGVAQVKVTQIAFNIPIANPAAPDAADLALTATGIGHSVSSSDSDQWTNDPGAAAGTFVVRPKAGQSGIISTQGLTISFAGIQVSQIVGTSWLKISETATTDTSPAQLRQASIGVPKFPVGFFAGNFTAAKPAVQNGESAVLSWSGSAGAIYEIFWGSESKVVTNFRSWKSPALTDTTSFMLSVSAQVSGQTVVLYFNATVAVLNPDVVAKSVTVNGTAVVAGPATLKSTLNVAGNSDLAGAVNVTGPLTLKNGLTVSGVSNLGSAASIGGSLGVSGATRLDGGASVGGTLSATAAVALLGGPQGVSAGSYPAATTDGLVIGVVGPISNKEFNATIVGSSGGITVRATGGAWVWSVDPPNFYGAPLNNSFILPVRKGQPWSVSVDPPWRSPVKMPAIAFYWIPLGVGSARLRQTREKSLRAKAKASPPPVSAPAWISGHAKLQKGCATVRFGDTAGVRRSLKDRKQYVVQLTPLGECRGLAVVRKAADRFEVKELGSGRANIAFDWTISFPPTDDTSK